MNIGKELKETREYSGISLNSIEEKTKIRKKYLIAIENNNFDVIPGEIYVKSFIRGYAEQVGLDGEKLITEYRHQRKQEKEKQKKLEEMEENKDTPGILDNSNKLFIIIFITLLLLFGLIYFGFLYNSNSENETASTTGANENIFHNINSVSMENENNIIKNNSNENIQKEEYNIIIGARERSWIQIVIDENEKFSGFIDKNSTKKYNGQKKLIIKTGNGNAIQVCINGEVKGPWGKSGQVIKKEFKI